MFFLLRCAFWLGLVFLAMARDGGALNFLAPDSAPSVAAASASPSRVLERTCARTPHVCAMTLKKAAAFIEPRVRRGFAKGQSLEAADLSLPWRGAANGG